jgi:hypothetical protein
VDTVLLYDVLHLIGWSNESGKTIRRSSVADRRAVLEELRRMARAAGVISTYCPHLQTHTDVNSERDITEEFEAAGFFVRDDFHATVIHDGSLVRGHIVNFTHRADRDRSAC